jgi:hypothetical protein
MASIQFVSGGSFSASSGTSTSPWKCVDPNFSMGRFDDQEGADSFRGGREER